MSAEAPEGCSIDSQGVSQAQSLSAEESSFMPGLGSAVSSRWKGGDLPGTGPEDYGAGKRVYGGDGRSPGPGGNSNYGVLEKMFCYLPWLTPLHVRTTAAKEKSQIQRLIQPLMWALRRFRGPRQALFWGETCQECWCAPCCDWRLLV